MYGSKVSGSCIAMEVEGSGSVSDNIAVGKDKDQWWCCKFQEDSVNSNVVPSYVKPCGTVTCGSNRDRQVSCAGT